MENLDNDLVCLLFYPMIHLQHFTSKFKLALKCHLVFHYVQKESRTVNSCSVCLHGADVYDFGFLNSFVHDLDFSRVHVYDHQTWGLSNSEQTKEWAWTTDLKELHERLVFQTGIETTCSNLTRRS